MARKTKPHHCQTCGENDPTAFRKVRKSECKKCTKAHRTKRREEEAAQEREVNPIQGHPLKNLITNYDEKAKKSPVKCSMDKFLNAVAASNYELVGGQEWKGVDSKMDLECSTHGIFQMRPNDFYNGHKCPTCAGKSPKQAEKNFYENIKAGGWWGVEGQEWKNARTKMEAICPEHGEFQVIPNSLSSRGSGCTACASNSPEQAEKNFYADVKAIGCEADESQEWKGSHSKLKVVCPKHREFEITPSNLSNRRSGCPECAKTGFKQSKPACLYFIGRNIRSCNVCKFGITNWVKEGHRYSNKKMVEENATIVAVFDGSGYDVQNAEDEIYSRFKKEREETREFLGEEKFLGTGNTEIVFTRVLRLDVIKKIAKKHNLTIRPQQ